MIIKLLNSDSKKVAEVLIPDFPEGQRPEVIIWGERVFHGKNSDRLYWEVFSYIVPTQVAESDPK